MQQTYTEFLIFHDVADVITTNCYFQDVPAFLWPIKVYIYISITNMLLLIFSTINFLQENLTHIMRNFVTDRESHAKGSLEHL